ncbi:unnamed protein product [Gongylonema pulchrum]|uniref:Uncharacterized protein n=1 Tax=Gongylonema pulchrum TaxID=637853 RepID=A0A3P6QBG8_9BILA|nr:unnamed protein product [Gongylonema pulchrum]
MYCFLNGEVQNAVKRQCSKVKLFVASFAIFSDRRRYETERTYIPDVTNQMNDKIGMPMEELNNMTS